MTLFLTGRFTDCAKISKKCEYIAELQLHARYISLNESFLVDQFQKGLANELWDKLVNQGKPANLEDYFNAVRL